MTKRLTNEYVLETFETTRDWENYLKDNQYKLNILHSGSIYGVNSVVLSKIGMSSSENFIVWIKKHSYEQTEKIIIHKQILK